MLQLLGLTGWEAVAGR